MEPVRIGLIGAGRIGASHARLLSQHVPEARLTLVADPRPGVATELAGPLGARGLTDAAQAFADPEIDAIVITASSTAHADLIVAAAEAGKSVFCEKPAGMTLAEVDRGITATDAAGVTFQVGFNRRFAHDFVAGRAAIDEGRIGTPHLLRSVTRDPGLADPGSVPPWTIFTQTLIHDFDSLLWLNPGAEPVSVYAVAEALVAPSFQEKGLLDTAVVVIRFDNGALATAEASFSASYGYDVRGEVFGSAGMIQMGGAARSPLVVSDRSGRRQDTVRGDVELFGDAYTAELREFALAVREKRRPAVTGHDARRALAIALACIDSVRADGPVQLDGAGR